MKGETHASLKALDGYIAFHRLLIFMVTEFPQLQELVDKRIEDFIKDESNRHKSKLPSMGEFLPLLTVSSKYSWSDLAAAVLQEVLTRNVLWVLKKYPELQKVPMVIKEVKAEMEANR